MRSSPTLTLQRRCAARWLALVLVLALGATAPPLTGAQTPTAGLPSLGDVPGMSIATERRLGDRIARDIFRSPDYLDDPVLSEYLQSLWLPLMNAARARGDVPPELAERLAWEVMISRDRSVNAFALPGGYLGVHLGLIGITQTPDQLASVLAHELIHVSQRHIARMLTHQDRMAPWMLGAMILGALAAHANADVTNAAIAGSQAVAAQTQLNFSRDMEREADRLGFGVLTEAGFDGYGFVSMFELLQQAARLNDDGSFPYLRTHPLTSERMAEMRARLPLTAPAQAAPPGSWQPAPLAPVQARAATPSVALHALMAARARVLAESAPDRLAAWLHSAQAASAGPAERYMAALAAQRLGQPERALELAQRLRAEVAPEAHWAVDALLLELLLTAPPTPAGPAQTRRAELLAELREQALRGSGRSNALLGAQAAIATGQAQRAQTRLQSWVVQNPRDALAWQTLASAHQARGQTLRAIRAEAESHVAQLDHAGALERLRAAQDLPQALRAADPMELAIVDSRLREVEYLWRESQRED